MSTNISRENKQQLLSRLEQLRQHIQAGNHENKPQLLEHIQKLEQDLCSRRYGLVYEEHREAVEDKLEQHAAVLVPEEDMAIPGDSPMNYLIEGDNLAALTALSQNYQEAIDFIYIDPPYNAGKEDFLYSDRYVDEKDSFRHSKWSSFMAKRLRLARALLKEDGIILISIDETEYASLKLLCDEIFGSKNLLSVHHIQVRYATKNLNARKAFQECIEYVLLYAKNASVFRPNRPKTAYSLDAFRYQIRELAEPTRIQVGDREVDVFTQGQWELAKVEPGIHNLKETWVTGSIYSGTGHGKTYQKIVEPRLETDGYQCLYKIYGLGEDGLGYRYYTGPQKVTATKGKMFTGVPLEKRKAVEDGTAVKYGVIPNFYDFSPDFGNIRHEGGVAFNSGKKPVKMLKQFLNYHPGKDITVLDFFAGSGSTGHAVLALNKEDGGSRRFILCNSAEKDICRKVAYPRLQNVLKELPGSLTFLRLDYIPKD